MIGPGICRETLRRRKIEKWSLQDLEYGQKTEEILKMRDTHFRTCNMARKLINEENENLTWQDRKLARNTEKREKI